MRLYVLDNGSVHGSWRIFFKNRKQSPGDWLEFPCSMFLLDTPQGKILYDGGIHPGGIRAKSLSYRYQTRHQTLKSQLALCGTKVEDINMVILSHMHYDHVGNLFLFPHAEVVVSRKEYNYAWKMVTEPEDEGGNAYCRQDFDVPVKKWTFLDEDTELLPGIEAVMLPGHTPGMMGLVVHLENRTFILPQDCLYTARHMEEPAVRPGMVYSEEQFGSSVDKVRMLQEKYDADIIYGHSMRQRERLRMAPEFYD